MISLRNKIGPYLILFIVIVFGYWQVSFFVYGLKWDLIDVVLPFRYYFSECIHSGYFPFWNPYQQTGTPFFADLQAPTYYPELLIISILGGYGIYTMHILFIIYLFIAAIGIYKLSYHFNKSTNASLIASLAYSFSGYIVGHGQHFFLLVGVAWIPFVILSYIKLNQNRKIIDTLKSGIFVFLMVTGAYQALSIAMLYLVLSIFIYFLINTLVEKDPKKTLQIIKFNLLFALIVVILCLPLISSTLEILSSVDRLGKGVGLNKTLAFGQPYTTFLSFIIPFSTLKYNEFFGNVDFSLINHYFGIITLLFFFISLFQKHSILRYLILGFGLIVFLMSFDFLPIREIIYRNVPLMNLFICAAYISIFGLLAFILFSANYIAYFEKNISHERNKIILVGSILLMVLLTLIIFSVNKLSFSDFNQLLNSNGVEGFLKNMSFYQNLFTQAIFHFFILIGLIMSIVFYRKFRNPMSLIILLLIAEIIVATQLNINMTVVDMKHKPKNMQKDLSLCPDNFPIPINDKIIFNDQQHAFFSPFWRNTYIFTKQISFDAFSSFELRTYSKLDDEYPNLRRAVLNNHLFYFSDTIVHLNEFSDSLVGFFNSSKHLYLSNNDYNKLSCENVKTSSSDMIQIKEFTPNEVIIKTKTEHNQFLTMLQTNYKGWKAFIDNTSTPLYTSNFNYRTIYLPKGEHVIRYEYANNKVLVLYIISNVVFIVCVLIILGNWLYHKNNKVKMYLFIPLAILILITFFMIMNFSCRKQYSTINQYYNTRFEKKNSLISIRLDFEEEKNNYDSLTVFSGGKSFKVDTDTEFLPIVELVQKNKKIKKGTLIVKANVYTKSYCKALLVSEIKNEWHANKIEKQIEELNQWSEIIYYRNIPKMKDGDVIKVYLWNPNKSEFIIDNISVDLYD